MPCKVYRYSCYAYLLMTKVDLSDGVSTEDLVWPNVNLVGCIKVNSRLRFSDL